MSFRDLRDFIQALEKAGQLVRINRPVDPNQEITVIQHRVIQSKGPALLFENVIGAGYRLVTNLFGTYQRVEMAFGMHPEKLGQLLAEAAEGVLHPSFNGFWRNRRAFMRLATARMRKVTTGPVMETVQQPADLNRLPVLTCWPEDGGPFFTLPLVHTTDPVNGQGNLGIYRMQLFDAGSTGMHWQIEKGGGFHYYSACQHGRALPVSVFLGGPPALIVAAVAPLPEGFDERVLAALIMGRSLEVIFRKDSGHRVPARAEFVLEGSVTPGDMHREGPFGDHFGHYSHAADFPVLRVRRILARKDAIYPATVVGKPVQEDYYLGEALQQMALPLMKLMRPAVKDLWAYPETGFHPLAVASVRQSYQHEALKHALGLLGEGQLSLTKVMVTVDPEVRASDFPAVSRAVWRNLSPDAIHLLVPTAQDTLDFTGPVMNTGSRLILLANRPFSGPVRRPAGCRLPARHSWPRQVRAINSMGPAFLMVRLEEGCDDIEPVRQWLARDTDSSCFLFHILVSDDVDIDDPTMALWGWFTRFDPAADLYPSGRRLNGNRVVFEFPIAIDARWKKGYPNPVAFDRKVVTRVEKRWTSYGIPD